MILRILRFFKDLGVNADALGAFIAGLDNNTTCNIWTRSANTADVFVESKQTAMCRLSSLAPAAQYAS
jgi:hypothetical protein